MISAATSPTTPPAPPDNAELPCSSAITVPSIAWATNLAVSLSPACIFICSASHGALVNLRSKY
ncbi:hypothetical protein [Gilliamella sp. W8126]|uniref:hypothetical protein n=1 Tax=Gilliamella sp. W8126 TaxID=2750946 RepID=UPI0018DC57D6|nr:hypothetical protein [Gilliamella sp. W8126]